MTAKTRPPPQSIKIAHLRMQEARPGARVRILIRLGMYQFTLGKGETLSNQTVAVVAGALLQIHIADPGKLMGASDDLLIGVLLPTGLIQPMRLASLDPTGRTYDIAVPKQTPLRVSINSTQFQIVDNNGSGLSPHPSAGNSSAGGVATGSVVTLPAPSAVNGPPITFTVTGRR